MMKRFTYLSILIIWGCNTLDEQTAPLEGEFYIQDGWLAFSSKKYDEAGKHFNTAIETNESGSEFHFLSYVGLGWTYIYKANSISELSDNGLVKSAGENFDFALNLLSELIGKLSDRDIDNLYAGLALQRAYFAKQKSANVTEWETTNAELSDTVRIFYEESIEYSKHLESDFVFEHDFSLTYNDIILLRSGNYIWLGDILTAIEEYKQLDFNELDFEITENCNKDKVKEDTIVECLCIVDYDGICPIGEE